ncbi:hypothetical protein D924_02910 [Enterococcus faecalis 06-MB-S-10]|nr:hypothetical protein [Enterococcus faecalis]EPH80610.1 hypothetical protein D924_02910 [Enterococcus faecalis 06-MB-S-10]EPH85347.1 hypothetical protein D923_03121 [Enterococcus faecalis 06-MB-S-04]EPH89072.1 hypothetical protein D921_02813 [Enterococcus faecalis F01966]TBH15040.1 hypothetical protein EYC52_12175 [Enterococcus faecalis]
MEMFFMKIFVGLAIASSIITGSILGSQIQDDAIENHEESTFNQVELLKPGTISGEMKVENVKYKWMEASFGGTNRGYTINPGKLSYQLSPNPHKDPWYNKNQVKFYNLGAKQIEKQANEGKWHSKGWPENIYNISINNVNYTLTK